MKKIALAIVAIVILMLAFYALNAYIYVEKQGTTLVNTPIRMTLSGEYICLPHKDTTGPQTLECMSGLKADNGLTYAIDFALMSQEMAPLQVGDKIRANGVFVHIENLSTDYWQKYDIVGVFSVTDSVEKI